MNSWENSSNLMALLQAAFCRGQKYTRGSDSRSQQQSYIYLYIYLFIYLFRHTTTSKRTGGYSCRSEYEDYTIRHISQNCWQWWLWSLLVNRHNIHCCRACQLVQKCKNVLLAAPLNQHYGSAPLIPHRATPHASPRAAATASSVRPCDQPSTPRARLFCDGIPRVIVKYCRMLWCLETYVIADFLSVVGASFV